MFGAVRADVAGKRVKLSRRVGLGMLTCLASWLLVSPSLSATDRTGQYRGGVPGVPGDRFVLDVRARGDALTGKFKASDALVACRGVAARVSLPVLKVKFHTATQFIGTRYERLANGDETYYEVKGELLDRGKVEGEFA